MAITNVEVVKNLNESSTNLIRRFQKRVQESGILNVARSTRYRIRPQSRLSRKESALRMLKKRSEYERLKKLGKIIEKIPKQKGR